MTKKVRHRTIRRPLIVAVAIGAATLAAVPATTGVVAPVTMRTSPTLPPGDGPDLDLRSDPAALTVGDLIGGVPGPGVGADLPATADIEALIAQALAAPSLAWSASTAPSLTSVIDVPAPLPVSAITSTARPGTAAAAAIDFALAQRGLPYVWGGNGPSEGDVGFDCSGLTTAAYDHAGISLPRTAHTQYYAGPHVPAGVDLEPGDLVFYGAPQRVHHVGLYIGEGRMVNAPTFGKPVRLAYVRYNGDDYLGATRPAAGRNAPELLESPDQPLDVPPRPNAPTAGDRPDPVEFPAPPVIEREVAAMIRAGGGAATAPGPAPAPVPVSTPAPVPTPVTAVPLVTAVPPVTVSGPDPDPSTSPDLTPPDPRPSAPQSPESRSPESRSPESPSPESLSPEPTSPSETDPPRPAGGPAVAGTPEPTTREATAPETNARESEPQGAAGTTREPTAEPDTGEPPVPSRLTLPGGTKLDLIRAERGTDGLPPGRSGATLNWRPGEDGGWTAAVRLPAGTDTTGLSTGATITVTGADGTGRPLTVRARRTLDPADAAESARRATSAPRLVLLLPDGEQVLVVVAE